ncbi:hypothetical protein H0H93_009388 [Arthromyces matolae]|nr:hypothetical protein H0H93_009388 [Arthromyces matolae]
MLHSASPNGKAMSLPYSLDFELIDLELQPRLRPDDPDINDFDAAVIADIGLCTTPPCRWILSSPNARWIPTFNVGSHETFMRADGRFAMDDRTLWPQFFCERFEYIAAIPRRHQFFNRDHLDEPMDIMWWTPTNIDFERIDGDTLSHYAGVPNGVVLGRLPDRRILELRVIKDQCVRSAQEYVAKHGRSTVGLLAQSLRHTWARITAIPFTFREMIVHVAELQRTCLDIKAFLDYHTIYLPRLTMTDDELKDISVNHNIWGAVTTDARIVQDMVRMRIPVWHLRPSYQLPHNINIISVEIPTPPHRMVITTLDNTPERIIFSGGPGTQRQMSMQRIGCIYLDLFVTRSELATVNPSTGSITREMVSGDSQRPQPVPLDNAPYPSHHRDLPLTAPKQPATPNHPFPPFPLQPISVSSSTTPNQGPSQRRGTLLKKFSARNSKGRSPVASGIKAVALAPRNKFEDVGWDAMPRSHSPWSAALQSVGVWVKQQNETLTGVVPLGYVYPDPGLIAGSQNHRQIYFMMWLARRSYILWNECSNGFKVEDRPRPQAWRDFLGMYLTGHEPTLTSKVAVRRREVADRFTAKGVVLQPYDDHVTWQGQLISTVEDIPTLVATQVLWELFEQNFRVELLTLERTVMANDWSDPNLCVEREHLVQQVLFDCETGNPGGLYLVTKIPMQDMGLMAHDWRVRSNFVHNLHTLMKSWPPRWPIFLLPILPLVPVMSRRKVPPQNRDQPDAPSLPIFHSSDRFGLHSTSELENTRRPYGTGRLLFPRVDAYGPTGPMIQRNQPGSYHLPDHSQEGGVLTPSRDGNIDEVIGESAHRRKKENQCIKWETIVLPSLIDPYLSLLRVTDSHRSPITSENIVTCECRPESRKLNVAAIYFDRVDTVQVCSCSAAVQLVSRGLFPCAPERPTLAVNFSLLEFVHELFLRIAPNNTAWCEALEAFLASRQYLWNSKQNLQNVQAIIFGRNVLYALGEAQTTAKIQISRAVERVDVIVCLDANFTQKRRKGPYAGGHGRHDMHPETVFLAESEVKDMEKLVESVRPSQPRTQQQTALGEDGFEKSARGSMRVPTSVLDGCMDSFTAADEKRVKASTQFFSDTGLMAILCRHDIVLWLVNMTSPGERQYYVLALLKHLFSHLPPTTRVGALYDIGCQIERSCIKWEFLDADIMSRLVWAVSVFHAFGHQWACQLIYHPRKRDGFGLSDGEGCERFWSSIKLLIPSLRVSGYWQRLFSLDREVEFLNNKSLINLGTWLKRKWLRCQKRKKEAEEVLDKVAISMDVLQKEWDAQVTAQTKPLRKQSQNAGNQAIDEILSLLEVRKALQESIANVDSMFASDTDVDLNSLRDQRAGLQQSLDKIVGKIKTKRDRLGVDGRVTLKRFINNKYLVLKMNASALKQRICARLRERKFELDRLERAYRQTTSSEVKLHGHIKSSVKRHEPGIMSLVAKYNKLCEEMEVMKKDPQMTTPGPVPSKLQKEGLFKLDVDDAIWENSVWDEDGESVVPQWLGDEPTRNGIKAMLELKRCEEEEYRLKLERCSMQEWFLEEWSSVVIAIDRSVDDLELTYQLLRKKVWLCQLYVLWKREIAGVQTLHSLPDTWGPDADDLEAVLKAPRIDADTLSSDESTSELSGDDEELLEAIEWTHLQDAYNGKNNKQDYDTIHMQSLSLYGTPRRKRSLSPKKRLRSLQDDP